MKNDSPYIFYEDSFLSKIICYLYLLFQVVNVIFFVSSKAEATAANVAGTVVVAITEMCSLAAVVWCH